MQMRKWVLRKLKGGFREREMRVEGECCPFEKSNVRGLTIMFLSVKNILNSFKLS